MTAVVGPGLAAGARSCSWPSSSPGSCRCSSSASSRSSSRARASSPPASPTTGRRSPRASLFTGTEAVGGPHRRRDRSGPCAGSPPRAGRARARSLLPVAIGASTIPIIAFAPITLNWFGPESLLPRMTIVAVMVFFPVMVNTIRGLTNVEPAALELMLSYAASDTPDAGQAAGPERAAVLVHGAADRDHAERHRRGRRGVLRRAAVRARDLHHARDRPQPIPVGVGRDRARLRARDRAVPRRRALERLVIPWYAAREMAR